MDDKFYATRKLLESSSAPLSDNIFELLVAAHYNSYAEDKVLYVTENSVIHINVRDPMAKYAEEYRERQRLWDDQADLDREIGKEDPGDNPNDITIYTNKFTGSIFLIAADYIRLYNENGNPDISFSIPFAKYTKGKKIASDLDQEIVQESLEYRIRKVLPIVEEAADLLDFSSTALLEKSPSDSEGNYEEILFQYTDITNPSEFAIMPSINVVFVGSLTGCYVYEDAPEINLIDSLQRQYNKELRTPQDVLYVLRGDVAANYVVAIYRTSTHSVTLYSSDKRYGSFLPRGWLRPVYINLKREWNIYFDTNSGLEFNLFLHALTQGDKLLVDLTISERKAYFLSSSPGIYYEFFGGSYRTVIIPAQTLGAYDVQIRRYDQETTDYIAENETISEGTYYAMISVVGVENEYKFAAISLNIAGILLRFRDVLQQQLITQYFNTFRDYRPRYTWTSQSDQRLRILQTSARHIFIKGYAKRCQRNNQGILVSPEDREEWESQRPGRMVEYPKANAKIPGEPQILYGCPDDRFPWPCAKENQDLPNKHIHPILLCCCADNPRDSNKSLFVRYYYPEIAEEDNGDNETITADKTMSSNTKLLDFGQRADLPLLPTKWLGEFGFTGSIQRFGVYRSINSAIHCMFWAVREDQYIELTTIEREDYVKNWRRHVLVGSQQPVGINLIRQVSPALTYQELYEYTDDTIRDLVTNVSGRFDTQLLYRILESYFACNIFVLGEPAPKQTISLEIPRNKILHLRERRLDRPTVLLYKHAKSEDDQEQHYELINIDGRVLFNLEQTTRLYELFDNLYHTFRFESVVSRENPYGQFSLRENLIAAGVNLHAQHIDQYGKCRGFYVSFVVYETNTTVYCSVLSFPQQPIDLPIRLEITPLDAFYVEKSFLPRGVLPSRRTINAETGRTTGLWYRVGEIIAGIYVSLVGNTKSYDVDTVNNGYDIPYAANPLVIDGLSENSPQFSRYVSLEERTNRLLNVMTILYKLYALDLKNAISLEVEKEETLKRPGDRRSDDTEKLNEKLRRFQRRIGRWTSLLVVVPKTIYTIDPDTIAKLNNIDTTHRPNNSLFSSAVTIAQKLGVIRITKSSTTREDVQIVIPSVKLRDDLRYYSETFLMKQPSRFYDTHYVKVTTAQFNSIVEFEAWVVEQLTPPTIITSAMDLNIYTKRPTYYYDANGGLFVVQNVATGHKDIAIYVAHTHYTTRTNIGFSAVRAPVDVLALPVRIYQILGRSIATFGATTMNTHSILQLQDGKYAALLRL